jgi:prephenate dehydratase
MRVAIQGEAGSYHHIAALHHFGSSIELIYCESFADVFAAIKNGRADNGVVAVENSTAGSVHAVYDLLLQYDFAVVGEIYEPIHHCLIGLPNASIKDITRVYSHPMALPQCSAYLDTHLPDAERIEFSDTAASVAYIKKAGDIHSGAIASSLAAEINNLPVLETNIENHQNNATRFLVLSLNHSLTDGANKTSLVLETPHKPGALWHALGIFADAGINLTRIESRPIPDEPWHYQFLIDIAAAGNPCHAAIEKLFASGCTVRTLGEYAASSI